MNRRKFIKNAATGLLIPVLGTPAIIPRINAWSIEDIHDSYSAKQWARYLGPRATDFQRSPAGRAHLAQILQFSGAPPSISGQGILSCGVYYPDATTTGVPSGTSLTPSGSVTSSSNGQTIQNLLITGGVRIRHNDVTFQNCLVNSTEIFCVECDANNPTGFIFQDCEINGADITTWGFNPDVGGGGSICRRNNFYACENAIGIGENAQQILANYIHDLTTGGERHTDGIQGSGGFTSLTIDGNSVYGEDTSCVIMQNEFAGYSGLTINNNLLVMVNGAAALYMQGNKGPGIIGACSVTNNRLGAGNGGYNSIVDVTGPLTYTGNMDYITCAAVTSGQ